MFSFESPKQASSAEAQTNGVESTTESPSVKPLEVVNLSDKIEDFIDETPEISSGDLERLSQINEKLGSIRKRAGRALRVGLISSSILIAGMQNAIAEESNHDEVSPQTKTEQVEKSELEKRIDEYKSGLAQDMTERMAVYFDGTEMLNKKSENLSTVSLSASEAKDLIEKARGIKSKKILHTHPVESAFVSGLLPRNDSEALKTPSLAPSSFDINSTHISRVGMSTAEQESVVVGPFGVWYMGVDEDHPIAKQYEHYLQELNKISKYISVEKRAAKIEAVTNRELYTEEILAGLEAVDRAQMSLAGAEDEDSRSTAIQEYIDSVNKFGIEIRYETNNGEIYK